MYGKFQFINKVEELLNSPSRDIREIGGEYDINEFNIVTFKGDKLKKS